MIMQLILSVPINLTTFKDFSEVNCNKTIDLN